MHELGITFNGYLFTKGNEKGPFLINFLSMNRQDLGQKFCFIDNHLVKLNNVKSYFEQYFPTKSIILYYYTNDTMENINEEMFAKYWTEVTTAIKDGKLTLLREHIKKNLKRRKRYLKSQNFKTIEQND